METRARLVVLSGPACSGKTALAVGLAPLIHAPHLEMDEVRARLIPDSSHTRHDRIIAYRAMSLAAELLLGCGQSVILDAQYGHPEDRRDLEEVAARTASALYLIECRIAPEVALRRFAERGPDHVRLDLTAERVLDDARTFAYCGRGLAIDTARQSPERCLAAAMQHLESGAPLMPGQWSAT
jgi:predicted kinase